MFRLDQKNAIVTGSGSGIGKAVALLFAQQGAVVHLIDLNEEAIAVTANEIEQAGGKAVKQVCNVTSQSQVKEIFGKIARVDILVNSAGVSHVGNVETTGEADFDRLYNVNVKGVYNCLQAAVSVMKQNRAGVILNLASIANHVGLVDRFAYSITNGVCTLAGEMQLQRMP